MDQNWSYQNFDFLMTLEQKTGDDQLQLLKEHQNKIKLLKAYNGQENIEFMFAKNTPQKFDFDADSEVIEGGFIDNSSNFQDDNEECDILKYTQSMDGNTIFEKYILKEQKEKERKKNGNIPKFLCRTMVNLFHKFKHIFENDPKLEKEIKKLVKEEKKKYDTNKNANNTLQDLKRLFCECDGSSDPKRLSFLMRKMLNKILRTCLKEEVIENTQIQLTKEYMIYLKTQAIRCRNKSLMCRLKSR